MSDWHGYFGIENLNLNNTQRAALVAALRGLGPASDEQPARLNHWRVRLDNDAAIFEALFNTDNLTVQAFKNRLASIFNVSAATITHSVNLVRLLSLESAVVTFTRGGTNYLRVVFFGYEGTTWPTWNESRAESRQYLLNNAAAWEPEL